MQVWKKKEDALLKGSRSLDPVHWREEVRFKEARKFRCKEQKGTCQGMHLKDKGKYASFMFEWCGWFNVVFKSIGI